MYLILQEIIFDFSFARNESHPNILLHPYTQLYIIRVKGIFGCQLLGGAKRSLIRSTTKIFTNKFLILPSITIF